MIEAFLIFIIGTALVTVYFNEKRRAIKAVKELGETLTGRKPSGLDDGSATVRNWQSAKGLLDGAQRALENRQWDKAEELCDLGFAILELPERQNKEQPSRVYRRNRPFLKGPAVPLKQRSPAWSGTGRY